MSGEAVEPRRQGLFLSLLCWLLGTKSAVLAVQLAFLLLVAALTALAGVLILDLPLWTLGALGGAIAVTFRIGVPLASYIEKGLTAYSRERLWRRANAAYRDLKADPEAWQREQQERTPWDTTLLDGLEGV